MFREFKAKRWTEKQIKKNLNATALEDCEPFIHPTDKTALISLKKIPLLDTVCSKVVAIINDTQHNIINMSSKVHITQKQLPKIYTMVQSICNRIGIDMPELYLALNRSPNAYTYGTEKCTIVIHSGLLECLEDDEIYAVLAHECGHIACQHMLYHTVGGLVLGGGRIGLDELGSLLSRKGILGGVASGVISTVDSALELALYHWHRCSELSADRIAVICCGNAKPVVETMMRLAGGTKHIDTQIDRDLFLAQSRDYQQLIDEKKLNKALEFLLTKEDEHPLLAVRASEAMKFVESDEFKKI